MSVPNFMKGGGANPPPPQCYNEIKSPVLIGLDKTYYKIPQGQSGSTTVIGVSKISNLETNPAPSYSNESCVEMKESNANLID